MNADTRPTPSSIPDPDASQAHVPSEFDVEDMDRYFRSFDDQEYDHEFDQHSPPPRKIASAGSALQQRLSPAQHRLRPHNQMYDLHPG
jgi:distribution and morphology protein 34